MYKNNIYNKYKYEFKDISKNLIESYENFTKDFPNIKFILNENEIDGGVNNLTLEELCLSLKINNNNIIVESCSIKSEYYNNKTKEIEFRKQKNYINYSGF